MMLVSEGVAETTAQSLPSDTDEAWHASRTQGVGASEGAAILGLDPWRTRGDVWAAKRGLVRPIPTNRAMRIGQLLERPLLELWAEEHATRVTHIGRVVYRDGQEPRMLASPDGVGDDGTLLEVKTSRHRWASLPERVWVQVQQQLAVLGLERAEVVGLLGGEFATWQVVPDETFATELRAEIGRFWVEVEGETPPVTQEVPAAARALEVLAGQVVDVTALAGDLDELAGLMRQRRNVEHAEKALRQRVEAVLPRESVDLVVAGESVGRWREVVTRRLDQRRLRELAPDMVDQATVDQVSYRLTLTQEDL